MWLAWDKDSNVDVWLYGLKPRKTKIEYIVRSDDQFTPHPIPPKVATRLGMVAGQCIEVELRRKK